MSRLFTWVFRVSAALFSILFVLLGAEIYQRITTTEEAAARHIQEIFRDECTKNKIDEKEFQGPFLKNESFWHYAFYWKNIKTERVVLGQVQFFPLQSDIWFRDQGTQK